MSLHGQTVRAERFDPEPDEVSIDLRRIAASKLNTFAYHIAGGGSEYAYLSGAKEIKIRFADHWNTSSRYLGPDINVVGREMTSEELALVEALVDYPETCKKTAFAMHCGLTVPKLKKLLPPVCYTLVCENPQYPNTYTQYVVVSEALKVLERLGIIDRIQVAQERWTEEDYCG